MEFFNEIQKQTTNHTNNENNDDNDRSKNRNAVEDEPSFENDDSKDVAKLVHEVEKEMRDELKGTTSQGRDIEETNTEEKNAPTASPEPTAPTPSEEPTPSPTSAPKQNYVTEKKLNSPNEDSGRSFNRDEPHQNYVQNETPSDSFVSKQNIRKDRFLSDDLAEMYEKMRRLHKKWGWNKSFYNNY